MSSDASQTSLAYLAPTPRQTRIARTGAIALLVGLAVVVPFAAHPVLKANGFIPAIDAVIFVTDLITAALLWAHYAASRSRALWALGCGYLFSALVVVAHGVTFPGALSDTWLIGANLHINFRLYLLWHLGLPVGVLAYVWLKQQDRSAATAQTQLGIGAISAIAAIISLAATFIFVAVLPPVAPVPGRWMTLVMMAVCAAPLWILWRGKRSALDQWLMVVLLAMIVEMAITSYVGGRGAQVRYATLGFYVGRVFMIVTSTVVLTALLSETTKIYASVARANLLATILREIHLLSREIELPLVIDRLTRIALENVRADRCLLLMRAGDGEFIVRAEGRATGNGIAVTPRDDPPKGDDCPLSLVQLVARTRQNVDLDEADPSINLGPCRPASALCLPLAHQDTVVGVLYLENTAESGVFTSDNKRLIEIFASQAAISLENAKLYTERVASEGALRQLQADLAHVSRVATLNAMTASIGHEVSQPLSGVLTNAYTSARMLSADPPDVSGAIEAVHRITRDANRAIAVIKRLRDMFAKKEPSSELVDLNDAADEVIALCAVEIKRGRAIVETDFALGLAPVRADRVQVQQVILNLLLNAVDAMADVKDRPRLIVIRTVQRDDGIVGLAIRDSGIGVNADAVEQLFQPFYTTKPQGMGVGLSICRSIIVNHGGTLWAEANDGPGATFSFSLPHAHEGRAPR